MTTAAEAAKALRTALKAHGIKSTQVSVRSDSYSMGSSITVVVKDLSVDFRLVKKLAEEHSKIRRCEVSGDILGGGNRYVDVGFDETALRAYAANLDPGRPVVNGFVIERGDNGDYFGCRWPAGDFPKAATDTVRGYGLTGVVAAALSFSE